MICSMRIVIVGAGAVGSYLAERLSLEGQDVVLIEDDEERAAELQERLDALVITGNGASPSTLTAARVQDADLLIAVSNSDGVNVLACHVGAELGVKRTVARIEDPDMRDALVGLEVDFVIDPGEVAAHELLTLVGAGGVSEFVEFGDGNLTLVGATVNPSAPVIGQPLSTLRRVSSKFSWVVAAVVRQGQTIVAHGDTTIEAGDHVLVMVESSHTDQAAALLGISPHASRRVFVIGSTRLADLTIKMLGDAGIDVVAIDKDPGRCRRTAERNAGALVICDDPTNPNVIGAFDPDEDDAVLALSGWDEVNVLACLVAKALGVGTAVARFNRIDYVGLLSGVGIDAAVSSRLIAAGEILRFVRRGRIHSVVTFNDTDAEVIDIEVDSASIAAGTKLVDLRMPKDAVIGGIVRGHAAIVPTGDSMIEVGDRVIVFSMPGSINAVERLFGR